MKRRIEEDVIQLAFGDLAKEQAADVERRASQDPEALKALATYRQMREGLRELNNIPEAQLSNQRLRDAVLKDGLKKPSSQSPWSLGWLAIPAAAAAAVFMFMANQRPTDVPTGGASGSVAMSDPSPEKYLDPTMDLRPKSNDSSATVAATEDVVKPEVIVSSQPKAAPRVKRNRSRNRDGSRSELVALRVAEAAGEWSKGLAVEGLAAEKVGSRMNATEPTADLSAGGGPIVMDFGKPKDKRPASPIVLIESEKGSETGAQVATESTKNVAIGG